MAEPPGGTSREGGAGDADELLATKLYVPRPQPGFVPRARLLARLDEGLARALILVCAPAGFGKTALLADWSQRGHQSVAWLSLDEGDNDPVRFWRHAAGAVDRVRPRIAERVVPLLGPPAPPSFQGFVTALINELAQPAEDEVVLVLDDYHLIGAEPVHESVLFLLEHEPPGLHVVMTSRADPPMALARLRARGQLVELRAADLRFTRDEAAALLSGAVGPNLLLADVAVETLAARTEGWAAGLQLAALSLRGRADVNGFVATFTGSHRYVLDYLTEEVLEGLPDEQREFLLETSVLERLSGPLCDAVTGRTDGQAMLESTERANLFLEPLDEVRGWWRYHTLFADLLRGRLQQQGPIRLQELHRNAAAWSEEHGLADDAVRHALAAGDPAWAARLIERHVDALFLRGDWVTLLRWLSALPAGLVDARPRLLLAQAQLALSAGDVEAAEGPLAAAETAFADGTDEPCEPYEPSVGRAASLVANVPATIAYQRAFLAELRGDAERTIRFGHQALAGLGEGEWMLGSVIRGQLAVAEWLRGRLPEAERGFASIIATFQAVRERPLAVRLSDLLGLVQRAQGRLDAALDTYQRALEVAAMPDGALLPSAGFAHVGMAEVSYQRDELDPALRHLTEGITLCGQLTYTQPLARGLATLAWIRQVEGDATGALDAMGEAERIAPGREWVADLLNPVPAQRARLLLGQGNVAAAAEWVNERGLSADDQPNYPREPAYLVLARVLLAQELPDQALELLHRLHAAATAEGRMGSLIEIQALHALALTATGENAGALAALAEALTLAHHQGYVRIFADEGPSMGALLGGLVAVKRRERGIARNVPFGYLGRLMRTIEREAAPGAPPGARQSGGIPGLVEPLSDRELEVLQLLAAGKQNREIAEEIYVTLDTVKKHVTHIFAKLGATNRTEATVLAREFGLLP